MLQRHHTLGHELQETKDPGRDSREHVEIPPAASELIVGIESHRSRNWGLAVIQMQGAMDKTVKAHHLTEPFDEKMVACNFLLRVISRKLNIKYIIKYNPYEPVIPHLYRGVPCSVGLLTMEIQTYFNIHIFITCL